MPQSQGRGQERGTLLQLEMLQQTPTPRAGPVLKGSLDQDVTPNTNMFFCSQFNVSLLQLFSCLKSLSQQMFSSLAAAAHPSLPGCPSHPIRCLRRNSLINDSPLTAPQHTSGTANNSTRANTTTSHQTDIA